MKENHTPCIFQSSCMITLYWSKRRDAFSPTQLNSAFKTTTTYTYAHSSRTLKVLCFSTRQNYPRQVPPYK